MPVTLNANSSTGFIATSDTSSILQLQTGGTTAVTISAGQVATFAQAPVLPAASIPQAALAAGVAGNGPAFSAYLGTNQSLTAATFTKLQINTEEFDTNSNYDTSTYRFTPTVAGYYQVSGGFSLTAQGVPFIAVYKNGARWKDGQYTFNSNSFIVSMSCLVYLNGSTDYVELYGRTEANATVSSGSNNTWFQGVMVRSA
jgi:hypothetical protein